MNSVVKLDPRMLDRLKKTLARRLENFEIQRAKTRRIVEGLLGRIAQLETTLGRPLTECRRECDAALADIDALDAYAPDSQAEIQPVLRRFVRLAAVLDDLNVQTLLAAAGGRG